jgi:hypothetical protein
MQQRGKAAFLPRSWIEAWLLAPAILFAFAKLPAPALLRML